MSDIFISYAREDRKTAQRLATALEAQGWSVWWDTRLIPGIFWRLVIERELRAARCVIVLWSKTSVQKNWVREGAAEGLRREILVPVRIENVPLPLPFGGIHTGDLIDWNGRSTHPGFEQLVASVANILKKPPPPPPPPAAEREPRARTALPPALGTPDFDRVLAPDSFPTALAAAIALRQLMARIGASIGTVWGGESRQAPKTAPPAKAAPPYRNILFKMLIYSAIAALTVIGLEALGVRILPFLNMTRKENTELRVRVMAIVASKLIPYIVVSLRLQQFLLAIG